jgi:hypothetical protein
MKLNSIIGFFIRKAPLLRPTIYLLPHWSLIARR